MLVPGTYRNGYVFALIATAVAVTLVGAWLFFDVLAAVVEHPALEPALLPSLVAAGKVALAVDLAALTLGITALLVLAGSEWHQRRSARELLRHLERHASDWHPIAAPDASDELAPIVEAINRLAGGARRPSGRDETEGIKMKFLEVVSRQLRTPLAAVRWNLEALLRGDFGPVNRRQGDVLRVTSKNHQNVLSMLFDWVEALEIERGPLHLSLEPVDLGELLEGLLNEARSRAKLKGLTLRATVARRLPKIMGDKIKLRHVLLRLLHNAIAHTPDGGRITAVIRPDGDRVAVEVRDSRVGIPEEEQLRIFKKPFRAPTAEPVLPDTSGAGLFVTKVLVEAHGGVVDFISEEGKGTCFRFSLPARAERGRKFRTL